MGLMAPAYFFVHCHVQVAGVEGRHIVLLLTDNNITDEAMLADVNGLLNTGEVTGQHGLHNWMVVRLGPFASMFDSMLGHQALRCWGVMSQWLTI